MRYEDEESVVFASQQRFAWHDEQWERSLEEERIDMLARCAREAVTMPLKVAATRELSSIYEETDTIGELYDETATTRPNSTGDSEL